jgi:hypothetical protein
MKKEALKIESHSKFFFALSENFYFLRMKEKLLHFLTATVKDRDKLYLDGVLRT